MSYAYVTEPPTKGKVVLKTSMGDLEVELWPKEAPKATRNFVQLCMEGYYDETVFHRIVKGFIAQGGDPTGTGLGGESIYGEPFEDEFHSRIRFSHRGLLAMANTGRHTNKSQFFFTLDKTEELNRKNTIFGKIVGDTIYNLLEIGEVEVNEDERPLYPIKINSVDVVYNPFDDIEPRTTALERAAKLAEEKLKAEREANKDVKKGKKKLNLLSFGDEAASEEVEFKSSKKKIASSHDLLEDSRLSKEAIASKEELKRAVAKAASEAPKKSDTVTVPAKRVWDDETDEEDSDDDSADERAQRDKVMEAVKQKLADAKGAGGSDKVSSVRAEIERVQNELRQMDASRKSNASSSKKDAKPLNPLEEFRAQYKGKAIMGKRQKGGADDSDVLKSLAAFKDKLSQPVDTKPSKEKEEIVCDLHGLADCKSCKRDDDDLGEDDDDSGWFNHKLHFRKDPANVYAPIADDYSYFDPRDPSAVADKYKKRDDSGKEFRSIGRDSGRDFGRDSGRERDRGRAGDSRDDRHRDYDRRDRGSDRDRGGSDRNRDRDYDRRDSGRR
ncbi:serologically defined colon cancer antigen 10 [Obelidium mucronatum]|nr:serologically defined colon cancer antigen 10 [Obelidium mucronatum]